MQVCAIGDEGLVGHLQLALALHIPARGDPGAALREPGLELFCLDSGQSVGRQVKACMHRQASGEVEVAATSL